MKRENVSLTINVGLLVLAAVILAVLRLTGATDMPCRCMARWRLPL